MILSYRRREESPPIEVNGPCHVVRRSPRSSDLPDEPHQTKREKKQKPFPRSWFNFFRHPPVGINGSKRQSRNLDESIPPRKSATSDSSSSSTESVNTIQSTHSFSFVNPKSYAGRQQRKRGRRIPVEVEDKNFRQKPQKPQLKEAIQKAPNSSGTGGTLTRIGNRFRLNLKSKYNLQSCESLAVCGTEVPIQSTSSSPSVQVPGPSRAGNPALAQSFCERRRQWGEPPARILSDETEIVFQTVTPEESQNYVNNLIGVRQDRIVVDLPKKRRAPLPPPRSSSITNTLDSSHRKKQEFTETPEPERDSRAQQRHRRCQSDSAACERFVPRLHVRGKRRAPTPPTGLAPAPPCNFAQLFITPLPTPAESEDRMRMRSKKKSTIPEVSLSPPHSPLAQTPVGISNEQKPIPRPWYRRNPAKSPSKSSNNPKPIINLPNFSKLDREAAEIVEEDRRRSAELTYKETAKELITIFNSTFITNLDDKGTQRGSKDTDSVIGSAEGRSYVDIIRKPGVTTTPLEGEEKKKLAIVQPQNSKKVDEKLSCSIAPLNPVGSSNNEFLLRRYNVGVSVRPTNEIDSEKWTCPRCTLNNSSWRAFCDVCFFRKGTPVSQDINTRHAQTDPLRAAEPRGQSVNGFVGSERQEATKTVGIAQQNGVSRKLISNAGAALNQQSKDVKFPPCQNFLYQQADKENLPKEKMVGMKLLDEQSDGELDISALREARVAFFSKNAAAATTPPPCDSKPNNFSSSAIGTEFKELNLPEVIPCGSKDEGNDDLEVIDFLLKIGQEADGTPFLNGTWKSKKFRPAYAAISENNATIDCSKFELIYDDLRRTAAHSNGNDTTNTFMRNNIQVLIRNQLDLYKNLMEEDGDGSGSNVESMVEACRKQGAVPKHLIQSQSSSKSAGNQNRRGHAQLASNLLRKLDWAVSRGEYHLAAKLAFELATLKVETVKPKEEEPITIRVYVEDRMMQQGPFLVSVTQSMTVGKLKKKIESDWNIPTNFQKWILGKKMAEGDEDPLAKYSIMNESLAFLYLVTPEFGIREAKDGKPLDSGNREAGMYKESAQKNVSSQPVPNYIKEIPSPEPAGIKILNGPVNSGETCKSSVHVHQESVAENAEMSNFRPTQISIGIQDISNPTTHSNLMDNRINFMENSESKKYKDGGKSVLEDLSSKNFDQSKVIPEDRVSSQPQTEAIIKMEATSVKNPTLPLPIPTPINDALPTALKIIENVPSRYANSPRVSRGNSLGETLRNNVVQVPFTRRLSGTLTKQIQMFEALNSPQKNTQDQKCGKSVGVAHKNGILPLLFENEKVPAATTKTPTRENQGNAENYKKLLELEKSDLIRPDVEVDCPICLSQVGKGQGVVLRDCLHSFCQECLAGSIEHSEDPEVKCPFRDKNYACDSVLQEREIKALVPIEVFHRLLAKSVKIAECKMSNAFHCQTNDCPGWCVFEDTVNIFHCPVCSHSNCLNCQAIHEGLNCQQYQRQRAIAAETDEDAKSSRVMLEKMIQRGEALDCPACHVVLLKKWGCDWVRCSYCKTEICWVTKSFRWGPNGKGDISGGCKCGVNGVKCHPKCTYCH